VCGLNYKGLDLIHKGGLSFSLRGYDDHMRIVNGAPEYSNMTVFPFGAKPERVFVGKKEIMSWDKHGVSRSLPWEDISTKKGNYPILFRQSHDGKTSIKNIKYSGKETNPELLDSLFPFEILRGYRIKENKFVESWINVMNLGEFSVFYSIWDHPIFISPKNLEKGCFYFNDRVPKKKLSLCDVSKLEGKVKHLNGLNKISFVNNENGVGFEFATTGFGNLMIWSPDEKGVFSIESKSHPGIEKEFPDSHSCRLIKPFESHSYFVRIKPFCI
jgi:hypothetical protein